MTAFIMSMLTLCFLYGMARVYVNSRNTMQTEKIQILRLTQTGYETAEFSVVGKRYGITLKEPRGIPELLYAMLPPELTLVTSALDSLCEKLNFPE